MNLQRLLAEVVRDRDYVPDGSALHQTKLFLQAEMGLSLNALPESVIDLITRLAIEVDDRRPDHRQLCVNPQMCSELE